jgi:hypothetical protein
MLPGTVDSVWADSLSVLERIVPSVPVQSVVQSDARPSSGESHRTNWGERSDFAIQQAKDRFFATATTRGRLLEPIGLTSMVEADVLWGLLANKWQVSS